MIKMAYLKKIFEFYVFSNIHVALAVFSLSYLTLYEFQLEDQLITRFNFLATFIAYNFIRYFEIDNQSDYYIQWIQRNKNKLILLILIGLIWMIEILFKIEHRTHLFILPFVFTSFFYVVPLPYFRLRLRYIASIKLFLIALTWAGVTVVLPLVQCEYEFTSNSFIVLFQRFLFILALTIPFDIRDLKIDSSEIKTLPQSIGVDKSKIVGTISLLMFFVLELFKQPLIEKSFLEIAVITVISLLFLNYSSKNRKLFYTIFWVEAIPIFWLVLVLIFRNL